MERRFAVHARPVAEALRCLGVRGAWIAAFAVALLVAGGAEARPKRRDAKAAFDRGVAAYQKGNYEAASEALGKSYELEHDVDTLFAWAQAERKLDHCDKASVLYEQLLTFVLPAANRTAVEQKLAECKTQTPAPAPAGPPPVVSAPPPPSPPAPVVSAPPPSPAPVASPEPSPAAQPSPASDAPAERRWYKDPIALSLLGAGVVAGGVGTGFLLSAQSASDSSKNASDYQTTESLKHTAEQRGKIGLATTIGGGALLAGGVVWIVMHRRGQASDESRGVTGWFTSGGGGLSLVGRF